MKELIEIYNSQSQSALTSETMAEVPKLAAAFEAAWHNGRTVYFCGNGGSAVNANHLANDFLNGVGTSRCVGLRVESLSANSAALTCLANDIGYGELYSVQLRVKANANAVLVVFSGSGNSLNVIRALEVANSMGMETFAVLGYSGGKCKAIAKHSIHFEINDMQVAEDLQLVVFRMVMQYLVSKS